ncbi:S-adenosyl-L-methionine-dependent methyltransferase [Lasiosphaeria miniovina]|uniref:S-adenosyl-L-methionine-dependent methyltransferase n=1 Tax=Lasiosphaeria miniovina TaxID=1954250 RepID=A0AA40B539_9PEZI|nr:S-adenosyl-L-methionine-dependent methyltransferase [Lasiosphaeria miniovina]KAK0727794.1 S-adenosyl-L-methionine-dependent methyltransferase [Lasiosphaeria miniovina]
MADPTPAAAPAAAPAAPASAPAPESSTSAPPAAAPAAASPPAQASTAPAAAAASPAADDAPIDPDANIEIDDALRDDDSAIGSQVSAFTESLSSSVVDYPIKHGRRYHKFRSGAYPFPNDEDEMDRLDMTHELMYVGTGEKHYLAPVEESKLHRILDLGTGTGIWAITIGDEFPNAEVIGNDLSAIQPTWIPPNVKFEVDDIESPWVYGAKFDWIFCRYLTACILDWPKLVKNAYDNLNAGGWAEFQDFEFNFYSEDGSVNDDLSVRKWILALNEAAKKTKRELNPGSYLEGWLKGAGFTNVVHQRFKFPLGPWPKDPKYKEIGLYNIAQFEQGVQVLIAGVRKDVRNPNLHIQFDFHVAYGQKPE